MAKHIRRFIPSEDTVMPLGAKIIKIGAIEDRPLIWAEVNDDYPKEKRCFIVRLTGDGVPDGATHLDTVIMPQGFVCHIYEDQKI